MSKNKTRKLRGLKTNKDTHSFFNQHEIYGGKAVIFNRTEKSDIWYFRMYLLKEQKYFRKSLKTKDYHEAIKLGESEFSTSKKYLFKRKL